MNTPNGTLERIIELGCTLQQIPAPTFAEEARAQFMLARFQEAGMEQISLDAAGNARACLPGAGSGPPLLVTAHLDTVFPAHVPLDQEHEDDRINGPGIGDNSLGLAGLLGLVWMLQERSLRLPGDLWLVATTGEEGLGNLKGMRALVDEFGSQPIAYLVLEGMGLGEIFHRGLEVRRYRITCRTRGGHSWIDFGRPSAIHVLAQLVTRIASLPMPAKPRTSFNVGVIRGGTSINTIASEANFELDLRSEQVGSLEWIATQVEIICAQARTRDIEVEVTVIGDRPAGEIPADHPLVKLAKRCLHKQNIRPSLGIGSTDANIALSRGLPAVCIGLTRGGQAHTEAEFILTQPLETGMEQLFQLVSQAWETQSQK